MQFRIELAQLWIDLAFEGRYFIVPLCAFI